MALACNECGGVIRHGELHNCPKRLEALAALKESAPPPVAAREEHCHAGKDGECNWADCPQNREGEPGKTGRHCPLDETEDHAAFKASRDAGLKSLRPAMEARRVAAHDPFCPLHGPARASDHAAAGCTCRSPVAAREEPKRFHSGEQVIEHYVPGYKRPEAEQSPYAREEQGTLLKEQYWCGCERFARWGRCEQHGDLDHDEEPPDQDAPPAREQTGYRRGVEEAAQALQPWVDAERAASALDALTWIELRGFGAHVVSLWNATAGFTSHLAEATRSSIRALLAKAEGRPPLTQEEQLAEWDRYWKSRSE